MRFRPCRIQKEVREPKMKEEHPQLESLYPFLSGQKKDARLEHEALMESVRQKSVDSAETMAKFFAENSQKLIEVAQGLAEVYRNQGRLFSMGNGGSSCDADHIAVEFQHPVTVGRSALPAISLANDKAMLTAVGNDIGFKHIFLRQIIAQAKKGDALIGISTSGNSENLLMAFSKAKEMSLTTIGLVGGDGGKMAENEDIDHCLIVPTDSIHRIQECHLVTYHILWDLVHTLLADDRGKKKE
jgi:D-sedoheptulose 7-phosphate isomerase